MNCEHGLKLKAELRDANEAWAEAVAERASPAKQTSAQLNAVFALNDAAHKRAQQAKAAS